MKKFQDKPQLNTLRSPFEITRVNPGNEEWVPLASLVEIPSFTLDQSGKTISGNWRITFEIKNGDAFDVNYEDYH